MDQELQTELLVGSQWTLLHMLHEYALNKQQPFLQEMTSRPPSWKYDIMSEIPLCQSMHIVSIDAYLQDDMTD